MSVSPAEVGNGGATVRPHIQAQFDLIDRNIKDPDWVRINNTHPQKATPGNYQFSFRIEGTLNSAELATMNNGWVGWTAKNAKNETPDPRGSPDYRTWSLYLRVDV